MILPVQYVPPAQVEITTADEIAVAAILIIGAVIGIRSIVYAVIVQVGSWIQNRRRDRALRDAEYPVLGDTSAWRGE